MKKTTKKLVLAKETVRVLADAEIADNLYGGTISSSVRGTACSYECHLMVPMPIEV